MIEKRSFYVNSPLPVRLCPLAASPNGNCHTIDSRGAVLNTQKAPGRAGGYLVLHDRKAQQKSENQDEAREANRV
jgi:hypothetical protein